MRQFMINLRIKEARLKKGFSQEELGKKMGGKSKAAVSKWENGENVPKDLDLLSKALGVSIDWLRGKKETNEIDVTNSKSVDEWDDSTPLEDDEVAVPYVKSIELAAGHGSFNSDDNNGYKLRFGKTFFRRKGVQKENVICFPVHGDSMTPNIPNGATVAVDTARKDVIDGDVYAICQGDLCRLKRLYRLPNGKVRINSFNSTDNPDEIDDQANVEIIGRIFHCSFEM